MRSHRCLTANTVWDRHRLEQVLDKRLSNAIKYSPGGGRIVVTVEDDRSEAKVSIRDHGLGIPPEDAGALFHAFSRSSAARNAGVPGLGLGLAIAKGLVEAHGGRIWAESEGPGHGSTFSFTLPYIT